MQTCNDGDVCALSIIKLTYFRFSHTTYLQGNEWDPHIVVITDYSYSHPYNFDYLLGETRFYAHNLCKVYMISRLYEWNKKM